jgi:hypothetical protein
VPERLANVVHSAIKHNLSARIPDCAMFAICLEEAVPEAVTVSTGPFTSVQRARLASSPSLGAYLATEPSFAPSAGAKSAKPARPISLGDDTQVVVRSSDPEALYDEGDQTMLADGARPPNRKGPRVEIIDSSKRAPSEAPQSTGDPTMFQGPAWVEQPNEGPTTLKTALSLAELPPTSPGRSWRQGLAALVTALIVVVVGGGLLLLASRETSGDSAGSASGGQVDVNAATGAVPPPEPVAIPPATGTAAIPVPPATGAARADSRSPASKVDASATTANADTP